MQSISWVRRRLQRCAARFALDRRGLAAVEFAIILPFMLVMFFGTVEFSSGVAVDRKVTLMARTLSDLTSQSISVSDTDLTNFFNASTGIMTPYSTTPTKSTISMLYIDPSTLAARVQWSQGAAPRGVGTTVAIPSALQVGDTYLIFSEVSYKYVPTLGYVMAKTGINLSEVSYTRPRQAACVIYPTPPAGAVSNCPKL
ncbi:TadE/TadG family type IV pilus assembly protein [Bradyrhizobium erythrophlei]|uniref:TadE/TadG family type IV pilus assembly protein n=1 Tax=Bradyrhizobium erythrophlei TaxID=1437360 RepID=UPI0035E519DA